MRILKFIVLMASIGLILACNFPTSAPATQPSNPTPTNTGSAPLNTATAALPTFTNVPTILPTATIAPTPSVPQVTPNNAGVNCRSGPDVSYTPVSTLGLGQVAQIAGRNNDSSWWYVRDPLSPGSFCWVSASVVTTAGSLVGIPIIAPPAAIVTKVTVDANVGSPVFCGGPNAMSFSGQITTNGPAKVVFRWELTGGKNNTLPPQTINFKSAGTKDAPDPGSTSGDCGNYTITLHVLSPNDISASKSFKIKP
jgi:hypothetical protein